MSSGPIAVLSDIHGNRWALEAVLADLRQRGVRLMLNLGDMAYGPLDPAGTLRMLMELDLPAVHILGNEDRILFRAETDPGIHRSLAFTWTHLSQEQMDWMRALPSETVVEGIHLCHGQPGEDSEYLLEVVRPEGLRSRSLESLTQLVGDSWEKVVACGHSHLPGFVRLACGILLLNPGSVGLQAFSHDLPHPHFVQTGTPHARYAVLERSGLDWICSLIAVPYDWESAARAAEQNRRPDWARALRYGWM